MLYGSSLRSGRSTLLRRCAALLSHDFRTDRKDKQKIKISKINFIMPSPDSSTTSYALIPLPLLKNQNKNLGAPDYSTTSVRKLTAGGGGGGVFLLATKKRHIISYFILLERER